MPTIADAIELVTSRSYATGRTTDDPVQMQASAIVRLLQERGAEDEMAARALVREAADRCGGRTAIAHREGGMRAGSPAVRAEFALWMPRGVLRD